MARAFGRILASIWDDQDFLNLDEGEQRMYVFLFSQRNLNHAGLLPLTLRRWASKAKGLTVMDVQQRLEGLRAGRFVVVDYDTEELLIRSFIRSDDVYKQPRVMGAMVSGAREIASPWLRRALLAEADRIPLDELSSEPGKNGAASIRAQVSEHIAELRAAFEPLPSPPLPPSDPLREGGADPLPDPLPEGGAEGVADPLGEGDAEGGYARARVPARAGGRAEAQARALPLQPSPTANPVPPSAGAEGADGPALRVVGDGDGEPTAQLILGEYLQRCAKRPPGSVIGQLGKQLKAMLAEGIDPDDLRRGMAAWKERGLHPSVLPSVVNELMNSARPAGTHRRQDGPDWNAAMARALAADAEDADRTPPWKEITA